LLYLLHISLMYKKLTVVYKHITTKISELQPKPFRPTKLLITIVTILNNAITRQKLNSFCHNLVLKLQLERHSKLI